MKQQNGAVADFIIQYTGMKNPPSRDADFLEESGLTGDDVDDMMQAFASRFNVDLTNYRWYYHHAAEGFLPIDFSFFWSGTFEARRIPLTIALLEEAADIGRWTLDYPNASEIEREFRRWQRRSKVASALVFGLAALLIYGSIFGL